MVLKILALTNHCEKYKMEDTRDRVITEELLDDNIEALSGC